MDQFPLEQIVEKTGSRFAVVVAAAKRAKQIKDGSPPLVETASRNPLTIALAEIAQGKVLILPAGEEEEEEVIGAFDQYFAGREKVVEDVLPYRRPPREARVRDELTDDLDDEEEDDEDEDADEDSDSDDDE